MVVKVVITPIEPFCKVVGDDDTDEDISFVGLPALRRCSAVISFERESIRTKIVLLWCIDNLIAVVNQYVLKSFNQPGTRVGQCTMTR